MEIWPILLLNGVVSALLSYMAYRVSIKKNRNDFLNNQISIIETEIDLINSMTYELYKKIFDENEALNDNITYRQLNQKIDNLHHKILSSKDFKKFNDALIEFGLFSTNVIESEDKQCAIAHLDSFCDAYKEFKKQIYEFQERKNT